jgi:hydroxymethylpyrimidine/phosphomethylpyrimidine kinase
VTVPINRGRPRTALTIAGTDSTGGAGIVADVRTFSAFDVWPLIAVTAVTVQSTTSVSRLVPIAPNAVAEQIIAVADDIGIDAAKTGVLSSAATVHAVATALATLVDVPVVVDPVVRASTGDVLGDDDVIGALRTALLPRAALVTPNLAEAGRLCRADPPRNRRDMEECGRALLEFGVGAALVTGGHLDGDAAADVLVRVDHEPEWFATARLAALGTHGSGCVLSAAVAAGLALGDALPEAVRRAKAYVTGALERGVVLGRGPGAVRPW